MSRVLIGREKGSEREIWLTSEARRLGNYVIGLQGSGKTNLLAQIALQDIRNGDGVCVITPHPDLIDDVLKRIPTKRRDDVILFDPTDEQPIGLHVLEWAGPESGVEVDEIVDEVVTGIFKELWAEAWGFRMEEVMRTTAQTIVYAQTLPPEKRPTLREFEAVIGRNPHPEYREFLLQHIRDYYGVADGDVTPVGQVLDYWNSLDSQKGRRDEIVGSTLNKVRQFATNRFLAYVVGQAESRIDLQSVMDESKILLVELREDKLGEGNVGLLGSLIVTQLYLNALKRSVDDPNQFHVIADEFGYFAIPAFAKLQARTRKFGVDILVAHQEREQLNDETRSSTRAAKNWIVFQVEPRDAEELADGFDSTPPEPKPRGQRQEYNLAAMPWDELKRQAHENRRIARLTHVINARLQPKKPLEGHWSVLTVLNVEQKMNAEALLNQFLYSHTIGGIEASLEFSNQLFNTMVLPLDQAFAFYQGIMESYFIEDYYIQEELPSNFYDHYQQARKDVLDETRRLVVELAFLLRENPIYARGGKLVTDHETPRSYSDVTQEWRNRFSHLPQYEAWVRLQLDRQINEHHIETIPLKKAGGDAAKIAGELRARSSAVYGVSRAEIEAAIRVRVDIAGNIQLYQTHDE